MLIESLLMVLSAAPALADSALPRGRIVETLHGADPEQTYALYLPTSYDPSHPAPIVYILDPRGRALHPLERFRPGAEVLGLVLASSYRSRSDEATDPNTPALQAMWADTHARLALDDRRVFLAGFSGTARAVCALAEAAKGQVAGVIGVGAGFEPRPVSKGDLGFLYYGSVGNTDFNYDEMQELDEKLHDLGVAYRYEVFPGPHGWMPETVATRALEWMTHSSPPGTLPDRSWNQDVGRARELEVSGRLQDAWRLWSWISRDYAAKRDTSEAQARAAALAASEPRKAQERADRKRRARERAEIQRAQESIALARASIGEPGALLRLSSALQIEALREKARGEGEESLSAQRVLNSIQSQVGFYLPRDASRRGAYAEAALYLTVASEIRPEDPQIWYHLAAAQARSGRSKNAMASLGRAVDAGFTDRARLESDADLASLRREPAFQQLVTRLQ